MDDTALIQLVRELDALKTEVKDLKKSLEPVMKREEKFQREEEYDRKCPYGWGYLDPDHPEKGIWSG